MANVDQKGEYSDDRSTRLALALPSAPDLTELPDDLRYDWDEVNESLEPSLETPSSGPSAARLCCCRCLRLAVGSPVASAASSPASLGATLRCRFNGCEHVTHACSQRLEFHVQGNYGPSGRLHGSGHASSPRPGPPRARTSALRCISRTEPGDGPARGGPQCRTDMTTRFGLAITYSCDPSAACAWRPEPAGARRPWDLMFEGNGRGPEY